MEETDLRQLTEAEVMNMYSNIIELSDGVLIGANSAGCMKGEISCGNACCLGSCSGMCRVKG